MPTLTIICPVYNEEAVIEAFYMELRKVLDSIRERYDAKILFVVDRSGDRTLDILKAISKKDLSVQILSLSSRFGHQTSLMAGIDQAMGDALIMMDSDLQHPPELIPAMLAQFEKGIDIVSTIRRDTEEISWGKKITSKLFYALINRISDIPLNRSAPDFRLISRRVALILRDQIRERNIFLRGIIDWLGFPSTTIPFVAKQRFAGETKYSLSRLFRFALYGITSFSKKPLQIAILVGVLFATFGFLMAIITCIQFFIIKELPSGWSTLVVLLSVFSGIQLIFLGIIGEYIGGIFDEVKGRPHYIIEEKVNL